MRQSHTPGPWNNDYYGIVAGSDQTIVCVAPEAESYPESAKNWGANSRLILAAPELFAFVERIANPDQYDDPAHKAYAALRFAARGLIAKAAIAKAEEATQ